MTRLEFIEEGHRYLLDGVPVPSVTQILQDLNIIDYSRAPKDAMERGRDRGSKAHLATQYLDEGDLDEDNLDPELAGYVEAYKRFKKESGFVPDLIEYRVFNEVYGYCGTLDRTGSLNGVDIILDIKTGTIEPWCGLQLAAYGACPIQALPILAYYGLQLKKDGKYKLHKFDPLRHRNVWLAAVSVYNFKYGG